MASRHASLGHPLADRSTIILVLEQITTITVSAWFGRIVDHGVEDIGVVGL
jgi:hypothetical protein